VTPTLHPVSCANSTRSMRVDRQVLRQFRATLADPPVAEEAIVTHSSAVAMINVARAARSPREPEFCGLLQAESCRKTCRLCPSLAR
jgi:hypothetical protein